MINNVDNTHGLNSKILQYHLLTWPNCGQPKVRYEANLTTKVKYFIGNYVSSHETFKLYVSYVSQLSSISIF